MAILSWSSRSNLSSCPLTATLHTHTVLLQIIHYFSQDRRVLGAESNVVPKFSRIYSFAQKKEEGRENKKPDRSKHKGRAEAFEKGRTQPGTVGRSHMERKKEEHEENEESMREIARDGEKLVVTRTTHCADCKWRVQDQSFPPLIHRAIVLHCLLAFPQHEYITSHTMTLLIVYELLACLTTKAIFIRKL